MKTAHKSYLPFLIGGIIILLIIFVSIRFPEETIREVIKNAGPFGIVVFVFLTWLTYVIAPISGSPFLFVGFYLFGQTVIIYSFIAAFIASITNFWIARVWGRTLVEKLAGSESLKKVDCLANNYGLQTLFFFRIFLGSFHDAISYAFGLTKIRFTPYLITSILGMVPGTFIWYLISLKVNNPLLFTALSVAIAYICLILYLVWRKTVRK